MRWSNVTATRCIADTGYVVTDATTERLSLEPLPVSHSSTQTYPSSINVLAMVRNIHVSFEHPTFQIRLLADNRSENEVVSKGRKTRDHSAEILAGYGPTDSKSP